MFSEEKIFWEYDDFSKEKKKNLQPKEKLFDYKIPKTPLSL